MEFEHLHEFTVLAKQKNFLEASIDLYISQSVLSKHIQKMEAELGVPLFIRTTKSVELSEYGELFLPYAQKILQMKASYEKALNDKKNAAAKTLEIGSSSALAQYKITDLIADFKKAHLDITLNVTLDKSSNLFNLLRTGICDLAFIREAEQIDTSLDSEFVRIPYVSDTLAAVLPENHPLANKKQINLKELAHENFLFLGTGNIPYQLCHNACLKCGFEPNVVFTNRYPETLMELVKSGMGIALLMKPLADFHALPSVSVVEVTPITTSYLSIFYLRNKPLSETAHLFLNFFKQTQK